MIYITRFKISHQLFKEDYYMSNLFFDVNDVDNVMGISNGMGIDSDGNMMMCISDNMAMDMDSGDIHCISTWDNDDEF